MAPGRLLRQKTAQTRRLTGIHAKNVHFAAVHRRIDVWFPRGQRCIVQKKALLVGRRGSDGEIAFTHPTRRVLRRDAVRESIHAETGTSPFSKCIGGLRSTILPQSLRIHEHHTMKIFLAEDAFMKKHDLPDAGDRERLRERSTQSSHSRDEN